MISARTLYAILLVFGMIFAIPTGLSVEINGGDDYTDDTAVMLALSATGAINCSLSNDGSSYSTPFPFTASKAWDITSGDGTKTVYFRCKDNTTNWSSAVTDTIALDKTAPSASSKTPTGTTTDRTPEISADLTDAGSGVDSATIVLRLNGGVVSHDYSSGEVSYTPSSSLDYDSHDVELVVADELGNTLNTSWSFTIASEGVGFDNFGPENGSYIAEDRPDIVVELVDTGSGINQSTLRMELDDENVTEDADYSSGEYSYETPSLDDGNHTVEVWVKDNAGKQSYAKWHFYVDTEGPEISLFVPSDESIVDDVPRISAKIEDEGSGVDDDALFMELNGVDISASARYDEDDETLTFSPTVDLTPGTYTVDVWASDNVENDANAEWSFTIASNAPVISSLNPRNGSTVNNPRIEISATVTDAGSSGIDWDSIRLFIDGDEVTDDSYYNAGSSKVYYDPDEDLEDGRHTVELRVEDNLNQRSIAEWSFTLDTSGPSPASGFTVVQNENGTYLSWTSSPSEDVTGYKIYGSINSFTSVEGKAALATVDSDDTEYFHDSTAKYYYALTAVDGQGNEAEPVFAGTCDIYTSTGWTEYECCADEDCLSGYYCNIDKHKCEVVAGDEMDYAEDAISEAEAVIETAKEAGKNVTEAEDYLEKAQSSFNAGNYEQAERFASLAKSSALGAPSLEAEETEEKGLPCCPSAFIILTLLGFVSFRRK